MDARASGTLNVMPHAGAGVPATIGFLQGRIAAARWAHREGHEAFYQLFERPIAGTYAFDPNAVPAAPILGELATLLREGVRRARALRHTTAVVPDDLPLEATGKAPGTVEDEPQYDLIVTLWQKVCAGVLAAKLEAELPADAFRIYRPLAQWLGEEALRVVVPAEPAPAESAVGRIRGTGGSRTLSRPRACSLSAAAPHPSASAPRSARVRGERKPCGPRGPRAAAGAPAARVPARACPPSMPRAGAGDPPQVRRDRPGSP